jgi:hypothetical protein
MAQLLPIVAGKGKERATEALKGDIYTRRWTSTAGKGKKKREVEHTVHVNPLGIVVAGGIATAGALALAVAARVAGKGFSTSAPKTAKRIVDEYEPTYEDVTVVDTPGYWTNVKYTRVWVPPVTHTERRLKSVARVIVMSNNFVPRGTYGDLGLALDKMQARYSGARNLTERKLVNVNVGKSNVWRHYYQFEYDGFGLSDMEHEEKLLNLPWPFG